MSASESLKSRLGYLRSQKKKEPPASPAPGKPENAIHLDGWERTDSYVWERIAAETEFAPERADLPGFLHPEAADTLRFFDLETTGLSGGAGTTAFLAGVGIVRGGTLRVRQVFLADFPGEAAFLRVLTALLPESCRPVSYNGKSYDLPLLRTRCLMNGIPYSPPKVHADLLYPARTLFRRVIGSCSLGNVEEHILGIHREGDVPGALVPEIYFDFLRRQNPVTLEGVFSHNLQDILSLARLYEHYMRILADPLKAVDVDPAGLGRMLLVTGSTPAEEYLRNALEAGNIDAGRILGFHLKRIRRYDDAAGIWKSLAEGYGDPVAAVERAKYLEHRLKNPEGALRFLLAMEARHPEINPGCVPGLECRLKRLVRKVERSSAGKDRGQDRG